ncbi:MAG: hypothetical protein ACSHX5_05720 [Phycisphaerales bacterium]
MSTTSSSSPTDQSFMERNQFLVRRLHSLTGILPIGVFLIAHLVTNSSLSWGWFALKGRGQGEGLNVSEGGVQYFAHEVTWINTQVPHLFLIETTLWLAIAFHSILGCYYAFGGHGNLPRYKHQDNFRYSLQRWSGYFGIFFIFYHVATLRWGWTFLVPSGTQWSHDWSASTLAAALQGSTEGWTAMGVVVSLFYFIGVSLLVFHFANGLWTAAITWGLTVSEHAQKRWGYACAAIGAGLMFAAWGSLAGAMMVDYDEARVIEASIHGGHVEPAEDMIEHQEHAGTDHSLTTAEVDPEG